MEGRAALPLSGKAATPRLYAILRSDITMSPGKAAAQAGHAFMGALLDGLLARDGASAAYARLRPGTKIVQSAPLSALLEIQAVADAYGIPAFLVIDSGHIEPPHFDGSPTPTALGLGPFDASRPIPRDLARVMKRARMLTAATLVPQETTP